MIHDDDTPLVLAVFREEAQEELARLERALSTLATTHDTQTPLQDALRITHTLKGSAGTVGLDAFAQALHSLEDSLASPPAHAERVAWADALRTQVTHLVAKLDDLSSEGSHEVSESRAAPPRVRGISRQSSQTGAQPDSEPALLRLSAQAADDLVEAAGALWGDQARVIRRVRDLRSVVLRLSDAQTALRAALAALPDRPPGLDVLESHIAEELQLIVRGGLSLLKETEELGERVTKHQAALIQLRVQPLRGVFQRIERQVLRVAEQRQQEVVVQTRGADTELDRAVADRLLDPLLQLTVNALVHGLEPLDVRKSRGKPDVGSVRLDARRRGDHVVIEVTDDGGGVDLERLRARLVSSGTHTSAALQVMDQDTLLECIFLTGISTQSQALREAGRGVGLDAARQQVRRMGGELTVKSTPGLGCRFTVRIPLTTAVADALLLHVGGQSFAVPTAHERGVARLGPGPAPQTLSFGDRHIPLFDLHALLERPEPSTERAVLFLAFGDQTFAVTCDDVLGPREVVMKGLGRLLSRLPLYAGVTLGDSGELVLVLDLAPLAEAAAAMSLPAGTAESLGVLVCDDAPTIRAELTRIVGDAGHRVVAVEGGAQALRALASGNYQLLLTDLDMPEVDGFRVLEELAQAPWGQGIAAIVITGRTDAAAHARALGLGATAVLLKPVSPAIVLGALSDAARLRRM